MTTETDQQSGTWRVMIDCGAVEEVQVRYSADGRGEWRATSGNLDGYVVGATARAAVAGLAGWRSWSVVEIVAPGAMTAAERLAVVTAERDALAAAVREVAESEGALETMIDDSGWTLDDERIAEERVAAAHAALDAALAAAEGR
jgi:hypothetical protein